MTQMLRLSCLFFILAFATQAEPLKPGDPASLGFDPARLAEIDKEFARLVASENIPGAVIAVVRNDRLVYLKSFGQRDPHNGAAMTDKALFRIYSMTKPIVSVAAMTLVEAGKVSLDDPLHRFIPAFADIKVWLNGREVPAARPITIKDLLRHTSGLTYGFYGKGHVRELYRAQDILRRSRSNEEVAAALAKIPLQHQPGAVWNYSMSVDVLGRVIEIASGQPLADFLKATIFQPLGMTETGFFGPWVTADRVAQDALGALPDVTRAVKFQSGGGGLVSSLADYLTFARMMLNGGSLGGVRILKEETVRLMTSNHLSTAQRGPFKRTAYGFGLGFAVRISDKGKRFPGNVGDYYWGGYAGTIFWIDPKDKMIAVLMMQAPAMRRAVRSSLRRLVYGARLK